MAELPGWTPERLRTASDAELEGARWIVYTRALTPLVNEDLAGTLRDLNDAYKAPSEGIRKRRIDDARARVHDAIAHQKLIRRTLLLDDELEVEAAGAA